MIDPGTLATLAPIVGGVAVGLAARRVISFADQRRDERHERAARHARAVAQLKTAPPVKRAVAAQQRPTIRPAAPAGARR